jgi:hypothetical protein
MDPSKDYYAVWGCYRRSSPLRLERFTSLFSINTIKTFTGAGK